MHIPGPLHGNCYQLPVRPIHFGQSSLGISLDSLKLESLKKFDFESSLHQAPATFLFLADLFTTAGWHSHSGASPIRTAPRRRKSSHSLPDSLPHRVRTALKHKPAGMDPKTSTSTSPVVWTPTAAVLEHDEPSSMHDLSYQPPTFPSALSPGLVVPASSGSGSSSWYQQIPPSRGVAVWKRSHTIHAHAMSSQSQSSLPSSFPTAGTLPAVGYDLFGSREAAPASHFPTLLGGQWEQGESSSTSRAAEMSSFFSPSCAGGLAPQSSNRLLGFTQPSWGSELAPLPLSLGRPSHAVEDRPTIDAPPPPIEDDDDEEEEIDVSAFLASDQEDQMPNASWPTSPHMGDGAGREGGASWMAPGRTCNNWPPKLMTPATASTCAMHMLSTSFGSMPRHSGDSSIGVATSTGAVIKPPLSSQLCAGASSSIFNGFAQPSSSSVLAPRAPNLQAPLLPAVKQEFTAEHVDATTRRRHPDFVSLVDDDENGLYEDAIPFSSSRASLMSLGSGASALNAWACTSSSGDKQGPSLTPETESKHINDFGSSTFAPGSWPGSSSDTLSSVGPVSGGRRPTSFAASMPCFNRSTSADVSIEGKMPMPSTFCLPPTSRMAGAARASSCSGHGAGIFFTDAEMEIIRKEKNLQELLRSNNPKKVKR